MTLTIQSDARVNSLFWIKSLRAAEEGSTQRVLDDLEPFLATLKVPFSVITPKSPSEFVAALVEIERLAKLGAKPMLHIDTHGNPDAGVYIAASDEFVGWDILAHHTRRINIATGNNLCVISAACFGFYVTRHNSIHDAVPFYLMIGPEATITFAFTEGSIFNFYRHTFENSDILEAYELYMKPPMEMFHSEKLLTVAMARYFRFECMGRKAQERVDSLVIEAINRGAPNDTASLRTMRRELEEQIKPSAELFNRYASSYLVGKAPGVTYEQVMDFIQTEK